MSSNTMDDSTLTTAGSRAAAPVRRHGAGSLLRNGDGHAESEPSSAQNIDLLRMLDALEDRDLRTMSEYKPLHARASQESMESTAPSLTFSDGTVSDTASVADSAVRVQQHYQLASPSRSASTSTRPSLQSSSSASSSSRSGRTTRSHMSSTPLEGGEVGKLEDRHVDLSSDLPGGPDDILADIGAQFD